MMNLRDAVAERFFERFERQRLVQVLTDMPSSDEPSENIHEQAEINEASLETNIGNICHPDLILTTDLKGFKTVGPWTYLPEAISLFDMHA